MHHLEADSSSDDEGKQPEEELLQLDEIVHQHGQNDSVRAPTQDTVVAASLLNSLTKTVQEEDDMEDNGTKKPAARHQRKKPVYKKR